MRDLQILLYGVFAATMLFVLWTYIFYRYSIKLLAKTYGKPVHKGENWPDITIIIPTYNEEDTIERKIDDTLALKYKGNSEIIIVDSSSSDNTLQIARKFNTVKLVVEKERLGKTNAVNTAIKEATGEIIVVTDANCYSTSKHLLVHIVRNFYDQSVGAVAVPVQFESSNWKAENNFWNRERNMWIDESLLDSIPSVSGKCYAFKRTLVTQLNPKSPADDVDLTMQIRKRGYRVISESAESVYMLPPAQIKSIFSQKIRQMANTMATMFNYKSLIFNPRYGWFGLLILPTRKLFPLLMPLVGFACLFSLFFLNYYLFAGIVLILITFTLISSSFRNLLNNQVLIVIAWNKYLFKQHDFAWEKIPRKIR